MAGGEDTLVTATFLLDLVRQICSVGISVAGDKNKNDSVFRKDCMDLVRRVSLLTHFLEEINGQLGKLDALGSSSSSSKEMNWWSDLVAALQSAHNLVSLAGSFQSTNNSVCFLPVSFFFFFLLIVAAFLLFLLLLLGA